MNKSDFYYDLPEELIAQHPKEKRDSSKLLVYNRKDNSVTDKKFYNIIDYLNAGDVLVINKTKVIPARIFGVKDSGAKLEFLLHKRLNYTDWEVLAKPAKRAKTGDIFVFSPKLKAEVTGGGDEGIRILKFIFEGVFEDILSETGEMPLPHYIHEKLEDKARYQTVYGSVDGSSAAPTAGLHFTDELLISLKTKGIVIAEVVLHVGLGTFRPVKCDNIFEHKMHSEFFSVSKENADIINNAKKNGKKVAAVGTTSVRVLESASDNHGILTEKSGYTDIFIYPSYKFKVVDILITNFHLPESTLIMLVAAFCGTKNTLNFYDYAVKNRYRFFSFGDACLLL